MSEPSQNQLEARFIAAVIKDDCGARWRESVDIPPSAFTDYSCRSAWERITNASNYEQAALAGATYFAHETIGAEYATDRWRLLTGFLQRAGPSALEVVAALCTVRPQTDGEMSWDSMLAFDGKSDPDCLMGNRYLGRSGGLVIVAPSGVGKSVMAVQLGACATLGHHFFGMKMHYRMRVTYIQAEDDLGDVAESVQGFIEGYRLSDADLAELKQRLRVLRWNDAAGAKFLARLRQELEKHPADLVVINPLFSFAGCNVSDQRDMSEFLRNGLNPILTDNRCAAILVHHTNKPTADPKAMPSSINDELRYAGSGSSELTNWARAYITLQMVKAAGSGVYKMIFAKRGNRTGILDETGKATTSVLIQHADRGLCWVPSTYSPDTASGGKFQAKFDLQRALEVFVPDLDWARNEKAIAEDQGLSTRAVRGHRRDLEAAA